MTDIVERLRSTTEQMASNCSVDMTLWCEHSGAALEAATEIERLRFSLSEARATGRREGMKEAAIIGSATVMKFKSRVGGRYYPGYHEDMRDAVAAAIRAAMEK